MSGGVTIGARIRTIRRQAGLTQLEFARTLGFSRRALASWESDRAEPSVSVLPALRRLYGADLDWLVMGDGTLLDPIGLKRNRVRTTAIEPDPSQLWLFEQVANGAAPERIPPTPPTVLGGVVEHVAALA